MNPDDSLKINPAPNVERCPLCGARQLPGDNNPHSPTCQDYDFKKGFAEYYTYWMQEKERGHKRIINLQKLYLEQQGRNAILRHENNKLRKNLSDNKEIRAKLIAANDQLIGVNTQVMALTDELDRRNYALVQLNEIRDVGVKNIESLSAEHIALRTALEGWKNYWQSPELDPEAHGEEFSTCWHAMEEALNKTKQYAPIFKPKAPIPTVYRYCKRCGSRIDGTGDYCLAHKPIARE